MISYMETNLNVFSFTCFLFIYFSHLCFPCFPNSLLCSRAVRNLENYPVKKALAFNKNCQSHKYFYVKTFSFFFLKQGICASQKPDAFKIKLVCPVHNFWTETWMRGLIRSLETIYLAWMLQKRLAPALGSGISHEAAGIALTAGQGSPPERGVGEDHGSWLCPLLSMGTGFGS